MLGSSHFKYPDFRVFFIIYLNSLQYWRETDRQKERKRQIAGKRQNERERRPEREKKKRNDRETHRTEKQTKK